MLMLQNLAECIVVFVQRLIQNGSLLALYSIYVNLLPSWTLILVLLPSVPADARKQIITRFGNDFFALI